ncbi:hypothetical protein ANCDUO_08018 [Ancylostoma duodenale]|uniref:Transthyretin-like family protein n=1 Tax=Ancylostoma duodenale TaxID=51022 RepID=A0A0C2GKE9_9BILA|nr:hypothetical protein ANCDUO_08018 [Ancylostoma duodenale]
MNTIVVFWAVIAAVTGKLQNITVEIGEITCGDDDYLDEMRLQIWDKDIREFISIVNLSKEPWHGRSGPSPSSRKQSAESAGMLKNPHTIAALVTCVRSRLNIPSDYVGGVYQNRRIDLNSTFDDIKPC